MLLYFLSSRMRRDLKACMNELYHGFFGCDESGLVMRGACLSSRWRRTDLYFSVKAWREMVGFVMSSEEAMSSRKDVMLMLLRRRNE